MWRVEIGSFSTARKSDSWTFSADASIICGGLFDNSSGVKSVREDELIPRDFASTIWLIILSSGQMTRQLDEVSLSLFRVLWRDSFDFAIRNIWNIKLFQNPVGKTVRTSRPFNKFMIDSRYSDLRLIW